MCGICGVVSDEPGAPIGQTALLAMRDALAHRGPDDAGHHLGPGVALGSRRLAVLDLSLNGHMPMSSEDGRYHIVHNGEVYNYLDLRALLEARGHTFRSRTDTEVILRLYAEEGPAMLDRLNGMFAVAIWDARDRELFLCRDRLGVKPLYYALHENRLYFASEQKALFAVGVPARFDAGAWEELLCFRYVAGEQTPYLGVRRLLPGHYMLWRQAAKIRRWWNLADRARSQQENRPADPVGWFRECFDSAVQLRRISDVPVGVLLSGGLDSSCVAASLALQAGEGVASFTVRFSEPGYDEGPLARQMAERYHLAHHELILSPPDLPSRLSRSSYLNDEPLVHGNDMHLWAISEYAKPRVTVLLSGEGADETLSGYVRYRPLRYPRLLAAVRPVLKGLASGFGLPGRLRKLARFLELGPLDLFVLFNACDALPGDLEDLGMRPAAGFDFRRQVLREAISLYPEDRVRQAMYSDQHTFLGSILDRNDRMTMGASIECRVPFLDYRLVEGLAAQSSAVLLSGVRGKPLLRRSMAARLPAAVRRNRKWGFGVPWTRYLRTVPELKDLVGALPGLEPIRSGPFDPARVRRTVTRFLLGDNHHDALVRQLVMITAWHQACVGQEKSVAHPRIST